jgi:lipopolysaccharide/colanic/teichoic acid biosynthesis glycosyltransferase
MLVTAIIIKLTSPGPALVEKTNSHMKRLGKNRKTFRLYKFRSMPVYSDILEKTSPEYRSAYIEKHSGGNYKPKNDPRVTPFGKFIRKYSIDETPQLLNVLKGEMSLVGPRPYLAEELKEQQGKFPGTEKYVKEMLTVKPGITGPWQVTGRSNVNFEKRVKMDAYYASKKAIWMDIMIILQTPLAMISGVGAV